jgi:hypothetical protein
LIGLYGAGNGVFRVNSHPTHPPPSHIQGSVAVPHEHYSAPIIPSFVKRKNVHKILQKFHETMSNVRHAQTKKCPDKPGEDVFAHIKEKQ